MFDFVLWAEEDPGAWYITAAHDHVLHPGLSSLAAHPGLPLILALAAEQLGLHALARAGGDTTEFTTFVARHTYTVWWLAKISLVFCSVVSFAAVHALANALTGRREVARVAMWLYATSFASLYYLNRVSVEPFMTAFFAWSIVAVARARDATPGNRRAVAWAAVAGACAISAFFTKIQLMGPWPVIALFGLAVATGSGGRQNVRTRALLVGGYVAGSIVAGAGYSIFMEWRAFIQMWAEGPRPAASLGHLPVSHSVGAFFWNNAVEIVTTVLRTLRSTTLADVLPARTKSNVFQYFEGPFFLVSVLGLVYGVRRRTIRPGFLSWLLFYAAAVVFVWWYRAGGKDFHGFHYLFPVVAVAATPAALVVVELSQRILASRSHFVRSCATAICVTLLHGPAFMAVNGSKARDHQAYLGTGADHFKQAFDQTRAGERIAVLGKRPYDYYALSDAYAVDRMHLSSLMPVLADQYYQQQRPVHCRAYVFEARRARAAIVLDFRLANPGPWSLEAWSNLPEPGRCIRAHE